jgi:hypothetical protein
MEGVNTKRYVLLEQGLFMMNGSGGNSWGFDKVLIYMCFMSVTCVYNRYYKVVARNVKFIFELIRKKNLL